MKKSTTSLLLFFALAAFTSPDEVARVREPDIPRATAVPSVGGMSNPWELTLEDESNPPNWKVYERDVAGSKFREFRMVGQVAVTPKEGVAALIEKTINSEKYLDEVVGFIEVLSRSDDEFLIYSVFYLPFLFKDRAMCERFQLSHDEVQGTYTIQWKEDWDAAPTLPDDVIAMPVTRGSWEFVPNGKEGSVATYTVYTEPGGRIPAWMVNASVGKGMHKELEEMVKVAESLKEDQ